jgi:transcriptional regulator PpsR
MTKLPKPRGDLSVLSDVAPKVATTLAAVIGDVALVLDASGVIRNVAFGAGEPMAPRGDDWVGRRWIDTVTGETRPKIEQVLREVAATGVSRLRQVNHPSASGADIPVAYSAVRLGDRGPVLAVGRDLRTISAIQRRLVETQQAMERDYWQMRQAETRYRLLFQAATDAVLIVDATTLRIVDANAAAGKLFDLAPEKLAGKAAASALDRASHAQVEEMLSTARVTGREGEVRARLPGGRGEVRFSATPFRSEGALLLLVRARAPATGRAREDAAPPVPLAGLFERTTDAVVITDTEGRILSANPAFLDLAQLANEEQARGRAIADWVGRPGSDVATILALVRKHGVARPLATAARGEHGAAMEIELSAAVVPDGERECVGFILRGVERRHAAPPRGAQDLATAVEQLTGLVGRVSLPDLVRDTTDLVERHLIKAALDLTGDNRTSAAEVLGLSRQSLYVKLRRHGLQADETEEAEAPPPAPK